MKPRRAIPVPTFPLRRNSFADPLTSFAETIAHRSGSEQPGGVSEVCEPDRPEAISTNDTRQPVFVDVETVSARQALVCADIGLAFMTKDSLRAILQACAESVARHFAEVSADIWTVDKDQRVLELQASAGLFTDLDRSHRCVPRGATFQFVLPSWRS